MNDRLFAEAQEQMAAAEEIRQQALTAGTVESSELLQTAFEEAFAEARYAVLEAADADPDP